MNSVACAIPTRLSFSPEAFRSIGKPEESRIASLGIHTPSAQEMLGHRVLQSLEEEKKEHQRYHHHNFLQNVILTLTIHAIFSFNTQC